MCWQVQCVASCCSFSRALEHRKTLDALAFDFSAGTKNTVTADVCKLTPGMKIYLFGNVTTETASKSLKVLLPCQYMLCAGPGADVVLDILNSATLLVHCSLMNHAG